MYLIPPLNVSFRRTLVENKLLEWQSLVARVAFINLNEDRDTFIWNLNNNGLFSVTSMYKYIVNNGIKVTQKIWHMKVPLKIKIFLWFLKNGVILTKDNLARRNWNGSKACCFCSTPKTIRHLFFDCHYASFLWRAVFVLFGINPPRNTNHLFNSWSKLGGSNHNHLLLTGAAAFCWAIWITRNDVVFDKGHPKTFLQVLFRGTYWLRFWALLQRSDDGNERILDACKLLESRAMEFFASHGWSFIYRFGL